MSDILVETIGKSRIEEVDFSKVGFGNTFTDHMFMCDYKNGAWQKPSIIPYQSISIDPSMKVLHYGRIFEGMKAYKDESNKIWLFRPEQNARRINKSAERLAMPSFPEDLFLEAVKILVNLDSDWVQKGLGNALYIRPFMFADESGIMAIPSQGYRFMIICSPCQEYYSGSVRVQIAEKYSRAASGGYGYAKAAGNYAGQFYPTELAKQKGFQQIVWTDAETHKYIEEAGTMNIFVRINDTLVTTPLSDTILDGITRKSVITLARHKGINIEERLISVSELIESSKDGILKEIFGSGTAAVITPISEFGYKDHLYSVNTPKDIYSTLFKNIITDIQYNKIEDPFGWRIPVV